MDESASTTSRRASFGLESSSSGADRQLPNAIQDEQRRRLAVKAKTLGRKLLARGRNNSYA